MQMTDEFYVLQGNPWRYQGPHTLKGRRAAIVSGYGYSDIVTRFVEENRSTLGKIIEASGANAQAENIARLKEGKVDVVVESKAVMDYTLRNKAMQGEVIWAGGVPQAPVYLAFSPRGTRGASLRKLFDDGMGRLQKSGELEAIYRNYGVRP
jgi:polar amino acid transport system substrate-binding protein